MAPFKRAAEQSRLVVGSHWASIQVRLGQLPQKHCDHLRNHAAIVSAVGGVLSMDAQGSSTSKKASGFIHALNLPPSGMLFLQGSNALPHSRSAGAAG